MEPYIFDRFTTLTVESFAKFGSLNGTKLALKLMCFKANGDVVFQGSKIGITTLKKHAPYLSSVHYMAHHTNLVVQTLSSFNLDIKRLLVSKYNYFPHSLKQHLEFPKLVELLECNRHKILNKIKREWIYVLTIKEGFWQIQTIDCLNDEGNVILEIVKVNQNLLCDVENTPRFGLCVTFVGSNVRTIQVCPRAQYFHL